MSGIIMFVTSEEMLNRAYNLKKTEDLDIKEIKWIQTGKVVNEVRKAVENGAKIAMAEGVQALLIKKYTNIPVVEITLTAQEIGLLIQRAKKMVNKQNLIIAIVGYKNMICDLQYFEELFQVIITPFLATNTEELEYFIEEALDQKPDVIIGNERVMMAAEQAGIPSLYLNGTGESLKLAYKTAEVIQQTLKEKRICKLIQFPDSSMIRKDRIKKVSDTSTQNSKINSKRIYQNMYLKGFVAYGNFKDLPDKSDNMLECIELAKTYARSNSPILIEGEIGTEKNLLAQSIHNSSLKKYGSFVVVNCGNIQGDEQDILLFGDSNMDSEKEEFYGAFQCANHGTILIEDIEGLSLNNQLHIYHMIQHKELVRNKWNQFVNLNIRVIATSSIDLYRLVKEGEFRKDLYYLLNNFSVEIPPLRERPFDLDYYVDQYMNEYMNKYSEFHILTAGAREAFKDYDWEANTIQLQSFCERLVLTAKSKYINEVNIRKLLETLYPIDQREQINNILTYQDPKAVELVEVYQKYNGDRVKIAEALNISKTTLWRRLNKYGIE